MNQLTGVTLERNNNAWRWKGWNGRPGDAGSEPPIGAGGPMQADFGTALDHLVAGLRDLEEVGALCLLASLLPNPTAAGVAQEKFLVPLRSVLLTGLPGTGKTKIAERLAKLMSSGGPAEGNEERDRRRRRPRAREAFVRVQGHPDLSTRDLVGAERLNGNNVVCFVKGEVQRAINVLLLDEINRTPPRTQAVLLEAMAEGIVRVPGQEPHECKDLMIFATRNPEDQEGTYQLPEAQLDRFWVDVWTNFPASVSSLAQGDAEPKQNVRDTYRNAKRELQKAGHARICPCATKAVDVVWRLTWPKGAAEKHADELCAGCDLVQRARENRTWSQGDQRLYDRIRMGTGNRAAEAMRQMARALAWAMGHEQAGWRHVLAVAAPCVQHRIVAGSSMESRRVARRIAEDAWAIFLHGEKDWECACKRKWEGQA